LDEQNATRFDLSAVSPCDVAAMLLMFPSEGDGKMARVFFIHWNEIEAKQRARDLSAEDHEVRCHWSTELGARWPEGYVPEAVVISLDRLPSHGRAYADWLTQAKDRQDIPLVFAGGAPDKIEMTKTRFPRARYCAFDDLPIILSAAVRGDPLPAASKRRIAGKGRI
jgi:hypothetical protein